MADQAHYTRAAASGRFTGKGEKGVSELRS